MQEIVSWLIDVQISDSIYMHNCNTVSLQIIPVNIPASKIQAPIDFRWHMIQEPG